MTTEAHARSPLLWRVIGLLNHTETLKIKGISISPYYLLFSPHQAAVPEHLPPPPRLTSPTPSTGRLLTQTRRLSASALERPPVSNLPACSSQGRMTKERRIACRQRRRRRTPLLIFFFFSVFLSDSQRSLEAFEEEGSDSLAEERERGYEVLTACLLGGETSFPVSFDESGHFSS